MRSRTRSSCSITARRSPRARPRKFTQTRKCCVPISDAQQTQSQRRPPILEFNDVNTYYGELHVLKGVNYRVGDGEIVCLLGGNASGKSTTMKVILGLVKPRSGDVIFNGVNLVGKSTPQIIRLGLGSVPEARRIFAHMTVRENLLMGAYQRGDKAEVAQDYERILELFP